jgi:2-methylisocitrate lyase-like PEP mutase family enzyme
MRNNPPDQLSTYRLGTSQRRQAALFRRLHTGRVLVLPNAWDVASARLVEGAGAAAVATTSAGVSWSLGAADGNQLPRELAVDLVARIVNAVGVPVSADIETGYGADDEELAVTIRAVLAAGAVGVNLEDSGGAPLRPIAAQGERIAVTRDVATAAEVPLFINARIDTYLLGAGDPADRLPETVRRAEAYLGAGADGVFVPGVIDPATIRQLVSAIAAPLNVMAGPGAPSVAELADLGVQRVTVGMAIAQAAYALTRRAARELLTSGTYHSLDGGLDYHELNTLLAVR